MAISQPDSLEALQPPLSPEAIDRFGQEFLWPAINDLARVDFLDKDSPMNEFNLGTIIADTETDEISRVVINAVRCAYPNQTLDSIIRRYEVELWIEHRRDDLLEHVIGLAVEGEEAYLAELEDEDGWLSAWLSNYYLFVYELDATGLEFKEKMIVLQDPDGEPVWDNRGKDAKNGQHEMIEDEESDSRSLDKELYEQECEEILTGFRLIGASVGIAGVTIESVTTQTAIE